MLRSSTHDSLFFQWENINPERPCFLMLSGESRHIAAGWKKSALHRGRATKSFWSCTQTELKSGTPKKWAVYRECHWKKYDSISLLQHFCSVSFLQVCKIHVFAWRVITRAHRYCTAVFLLTPVLSRPFIFCQTCAPVSAHLLWSSYFSISQLQSLNAKNNPSCCTMDSLECLLANCISLFFTYLNQFAQIIIIYTAT